jgi:hypothetical protein
MDKNNMRHLISKSMTFFSSLLRKTKSSTLTALLIAVSAFAVSSQAFAAVNLTVTASGASVKLTGPWWSWDPDGGPVAVDNTDGTWTVTLESDPTESMEYLWVVDGVQEDLTGTDLSCAPRNGDDYANRVWVVGSGDVTGNIYGSCDGHVAYQYTASLVLEAPDATEVRLTGPWWQWAADGGPIADANVGEDGLFDGTWTVELPDVVAGTEYLWVVDGVQEDLVAAVAVDGCAAPDLVTGSYTNDDGVEVNFANRGLPYGAVTASDDYEVFTCNDTFDVLFTVDMTGVDRDPADESGATDGPHPATVQGTFNGWCGLCGNEMSDEDGDGIWELTVELSRGVYAYKFAIGEWKAQEEVPGGCTNSSSNGNRHLTITADSPAVIAPTTNTYSGCDVDSDNDGIADAADPDDDNDGVADEDDIAPLNADFSSGNEIAFADAFGGASIETGPEYNFPTGAQSWAGFANVSADVYPFTVSDTDEIVFNASVPSGETANVRFKLERLPHNTNGDGEESTKPFYEIPAITVSGADSAEYRISLEAQDGLEFRSFIMYLDTRDEPVVISDVQLGTCIGCPEQVVSVSGTPKAMAGSDVAVTVSYVADDAATTGLGLRVHYDSSALTFVDFSSVLTTDNISSSDAASDDTDNFDGNSATDKFVSANWASLFGNWPGALTADLLTVNFTAADDETLTSTLVTFSATSTPAGFRFVGNPYEIPFIAGSWDFDSDGNADALTDGLMLLRYTFGLTGASLTSGAIASGSSMSALEVEAAVAASTESFADIDGNGAVDALTDGLMLLRYLFGLTGDSLISGAVAGNASRTTAADIEAYIVSLMP